MLLPSLLRCLDLNAVSRLNRLVSNRRRGKKKPHAQFPATAEIKRRARFSYDGLLALFSYLKISPPS
jgi:hypothetical protein